MTGASGKFIVEFGPIELGELVMQSDCSIDTCTYEATAKGSFLFIGADIIERGSYTWQEEKVMPISTWYDEKIGSKKRAFTYDFQSMEIKDRRKQELMAMPADAFPYMPLLNQVILDLRNGGPKEYYVYLSKHKVRQANIRAYKKITTDHGTMHHFIGKQENKDKEVEFFFLQNGDNIGLEKVSYGSFQMSRK